MLHNNRVWITIFDNRPKQLKLLPPDTTTIKPILTNAMASMQYSGTQTHTHTLSCIWAVNSIAILSPLHHWGHLTLRSLNKLGMPRWLHFPSELTQLHNHLWNECINSNSSVGENTSSLLTDFNHLHIPGPLG